MGNRRAPAASFRQALERARSILGTSASLVSSGVVRTEAEQLALAALRRQSGLAVSRLEFYANPEREFPREAFSLLQIWCQKRAEGALLQHLTGLQAFLDHEYEVGPEVLVPRPETEALVLETVATLKAGLPPTLGMEIGLGSGVISIELLCAFPELRIHASEFSKAAETRARANAASILGRDWIRRLTILEAPFAWDLWSAFKGTVSGPKFDFLISNPPYLCGTDEVEIQVLSGEPNGALFPVPMNGGEDPLLFYREIADHAAEWVRPGGWVFLEIPHERSETISGLFTRKGAAVTIHNDLSGRERILRVRLSDWNQGSFEKGSIHG